MGYKLFQRAASDAAATEFAATEWSAPTDAPADSLPSDLGVDSLPAPMEPAEPVEQRPTISHIGRYALKGLLGQGGLGQVHEAWDPLLSRPVAIKTLQFDIDAGTRAAIRRVIC